MTADFVSNRPYKASLTREPFLFHEMRTVSQLIVNGLSDDEVLVRVVSENLFQYPTEKMLRRMTKACLARLEGMEDADLIRAIAEQPADVAKQICLYAMMKDSRLLWDFMVTVIGEKYRIRDSSFSRLDLNLYFMRLQEQNDAVAAWSDTTITKLKQVLNRVLIDNEYLDSTNVDHLNPVWLNPMLESAIKKNNDDAALPAFNCFI